MFFGTIDIIMQSNKREVVTLLRNRKANAHDPYCPTPKSSLRRYVIEQKGTTVCPYPNKTGVTYIIYG